MSLFDNEHLQAARRFTIRLLAALIIFPSIALAGWTWVTLKFVYASGDRSGYVQKLSKKGWLCKTWEGELAMANLPGAMPQIFEFTVRDEAVAQAITKSMGERVSLHYEQHRGIPVSCFGDTEYFITSMSVAAGDTQAPAGSRSALPPEPSEGTAPTSSKPAAR